MFLRDADFSAISDLILRLFNLFFEKHGKMTYLLELNSIAGHINQKFRLRHVMLDRWFVCLKWCSCC